MAFWRGETLLDRIPALITPRELFDPEKIDCAAYTLTLGNEVFVTADLPEVGGPYDGVKKVLAEGQQLRINPGQFAFLVSRETIEVPDNAVAFISMKATYKLRGLINVSGFHVDPGWKDPLLFSVYNAGPSPVCLMQGMPLFLIWYASLDGKTKKLYKGEGKSIDADLISNISGEVFSPISLKKEVGRLNERIGKAQDSVVSANAAVSSLGKTWTRLGISVVGTILAILGFLFVQVSDIKLELVKRNILDQSKTDGSQPGIGINEKLESGQPGRESRLKLERGAEAKSNADQKLEAKPEAKAPIEGAGSRIEGPSPKSK